MIKYLPNMLSAFRCISALPILFFLKEGRYIAALWIFLLAAISDFADGYLARRLGIESRFGAILDPVADKVLVISMYLVFCILNIIPIWCGAVVIFRDIVILSVVSVLLLNGKKIEFKPLYISKINTVLQLLLIGFVFFLKAVDWPYIYINYGAVLVVITTALSGLSYLMNIKTFIKRA